MVEVEEKPKKKQTDVEIGKYMKNLKEGIKVSSKY